MDNKKDEQVIYLKDLLFAALHRWRAVLLVTLIAALLLGGVKGIVSWSRIGGTENETAYQADLEQYQLDLDVLTSKIERLQDNLRGQQDYMDHSVFMKLNPYEFYEASASIYVDTDYQIIPGSLYQSVDKTAATLSAYEAAFCCETTLEILGEIAGIQPQFMQELISTSTSPDRGTVTVTIRCLNQDSANALLEKMIQLVDAFQAEINNAVAKHTVSILNQSAVRSLDSNLASMQAEITGRLTNLQDSLREAEKALAELEPPAQGVPSKASAVKSAVIFAVLGGILGAFLSVCVIWVMHITSAKVYSSRTLRNRTGIKLIGCMRTEEIKCPVDRWLLKAEGRCINDAQMQIALLAANIRNRCVNAKHILISGGADMQHLSVLTQTLQAAMPETKVTSAENLLHSAAAIDVLAACDTVVLAEQCGLSRYSQISEEMELIHDYGKTLIGCVLLDG